MQPSLTQLGMCLCGFHWENAAVSRRAAAILSFYRAMLYAERGIAMSSGPSTPSVCDVEVLCEVSS